jgi:hypothetical protein
MRTLGTMKLVAATLLIAGGTLLSGCFMHEHVVGNGPQTGLSESRKVWYIAYGLAPITQVNTLEMARGAEHYLIKTEQQFIDGLIGAITFGIIGPRTVTVTR